MTSLQIEIAWTANPANKYSMTNNEVLRSVRYALEIKNKEVLQMIEAGGVELTIFDVVNLLKDEFCRHP